MTLECCYAKLSYLIGKRYSIEKIKTLLTVSMKGELVDIKKKKEEFTLKNSSLIKAVAQVLKGEDMEEYMGVEQSVEHVLANSVASLGDEQMMNQLKDLKIDFNQLDYKGKSPLHIACLKGHVNIVKFLIKQSTHIMLNFIRSRP